MISTEEMQRYADQLIHFSRHNAESATADPSPSPSPVPSNQLSPAGPSKLMSSVDAFREPPPGEARYGPEMHPNQTPQVGARAMYRRSSSSYYSTASASDAASEAETEASFGSTDDEPTIRPAHSSASSETTSLRSVASDSDSILTDDGDRDDGSYESGVHTPGEAPLRDYRMMSP